MNRLDFNAGLNYSADLNDPFSYGFLVFTDLYDDNMSADWQSWSNTLDHYIGIALFPERWWLLHKPLEFREN